MGEVGLVGISSALLGTVGAVPVGSVTAFAGSSAPSGWLLCYGQAVSRTSYASLFITIGTTYGSGDGSTTFNLPDLRGRVPAGVDNMGGSAASRLTNTVLTASNTLGATGGTQTHTLTAAQSGIPAHTHPVSDPTHAHTVTGVNGVPAFNFNDLNIGVLDSGYGNAYSKATSYASTGISVSSNTATNASSAHPITQPTIVLNYIIKAQPV